MQFDRVAEVTIGPPGQPGLLLRGLRVRFAVERDATASANRCEVEIYNLKATTRAGIRQLHDDVVLAAGYAAGDGPRKLFQGQIDWKQDHRRPPEIVTILNAGDGRTALRETRLSLSLERGCSVGRACRVVADRLQLPIPAGSLPAQAESAQFASGFAFSGQAEEALRRITAAADLEYSVQDGELQIVPRRQAARVPAVVVNANTGLLDSPERAIGSEGKQEALVKTKPPWRFRCLLNPQLVPGRPVRLESATVAGVFRVEKLRHVGDTHGDDWFTECEVSEP